MRQSACIFVLFLFWVHTLWSQETTTYVVQKKDSLYSIAKHFGVTLHALEETNHIANPRGLQIGQKLTIPIAPSQPTGAPPAPPSHPTLPPPVVAPAQPEIAPPSSPISEESPMPRRYVFLDKVKDIIDAPHVVPGRWKYIVLHHSATPVGNARIFDAAHRRRGMVNGLAYHFVIGNGTYSGDGEIEVGGRWLRQIKGGHLKFDSLNEIAIGICFVGDFNNSRPTRKQIAAAIELISYLREICGPPTPILMTHTEIHPHHTDCPGKLFPSEAFHTLFPGDPDQAELARLRTIPNALVPADKSYSSAGE